jgi:hypothetical protein
LVGFSSGQRYRGRFERLALFQRSKRVRATAGEVSVEVSPADAKLAANPESREFTGPNSAADPVNTGAQFAGDFIQS